MVKLGFINERPDLEGVRRLKGWGGRVVLERAEGWGKRAQGGGGGGCIVHERPDLEGVRHGIGLGDERKGKRGGILQRPELGG